MTWQEELVRDDAPMPPRMCFYAPGGLGKTTFAASMPNPLIIDLDRGAGEIKSGTLLPPNNVRFTGEKHLGRSTWEESLLLFREIAATPGNTRTLVVDTVDVLEDQAEVAVCRDFNCKTIDVPEWGAGYTALEAKWRIMLAELDQVRAKGIIICLLAHTATKTTKDPTVGEYDEYISQLGKKPWAATYRWADLVGFANFELGRLAKEDRAIVTGNRILYTQRGSGFQAKNRYKLPPSMPFEWPTLLASIQAHQVGAPAQASALVPAPPPPLVPPPSTENAATVALRIQALAKGADERGLKTSDGKSFVEKAQGYILGCNGDIAALRQLEAQLRGSLGVQPNGGTQAQAST